jgi:membrane-anchored protein YejM (alkaline phosphatase superfamily)
MEPTIDNPHRATRCAPLLWRAVAAAFASVLAVLASFATGWRPVGIRDSAFVAFAWLDQAFIVTLPLIAIAALASLLERNGARSRTFARTAIVAFAAVATTVAAILFVDVKIHDLYGFHINGFVLNLLATPGGIASLEASRATWWTLFAGIAATFAAIGGVLAILARRERRRAMVPNALTVSASMRRATSKTTRRIVIAIVAIIVADKSLYGYADLTGHGETLRASGLFPFYQPLTFRSLAKRLGVTPATAPIDSLEQRGQLLYPRVPIAIGSLPHAPPNVLWLAVESLRADALTATTMPRLWAFAADNLRFARHFSGGNRTRIGMFTMFYSLHGPYWSHVLDVRRSPVFVDVLKRLDYDIDVYTSAKFSYPEFDQTIFVDVPPERRHEYSEDEIFWHRDVHNVDAIIASLEQRDATKPFMRFLFFESTHAPYQFPDEDAIATPYGDVMNYALMNPERDIELIRNRYVNSAHFVDSQIGRLIDHLASDGLLANTIVVVTGDHGEELLEHGRWGHGSAFVDEQIHVPLVMRIPGEGPRVIDAETSHLDIVPSLLPVLGVTNPPADYALGVDVVRSTPARKRIIASEWSGFAYIDADVVATIPLSGGFDADVRRRSDETPQPALAFFESHRSDLKEVMGELNAFLVK